MECSLPKFTTCGLLQDGVIAGVWQLLWLQMRFPIDKWLAGCSEANLVQATCCARVSALMSTVCFWCWQCCQIIAVGHHDVTSACSVHLGVCFINLVFHTHHHFRITSLSPEDTAVTLLCKLSNFILLQSYFSLLWNDSCPYLAWGSNKIFKELKVYFYSLLKPEQVSASVVSSTFHRAVEWVGKGP